MKNEELIRHLDSLVFQLKLSTNIEDQEILKSFKRVLLDAYNLGYKYGQEDMMKRVLENVFKIENKK